MPGLPQRHLLELPELTGLLALDTLESQRPHRMEAFRALSGKAP